MEFRIIQAFVAALVLFLLSTVSIADVIQYRLPGSPLVVTLQGTAKFVTGSTVGYRHPKFGVLNMGSDDVTITKVASLDRRYKKRLRKAGKDVESLFDVADWCLRYGEIDRFYETIERVLEVDSSNQRALGVRKLKKLMNRPIKKSPDEETYLRNLVDKQDMRFARSGHYLLYHDTAAGVGKQRSRTSRAEQRLELLEKVYESFMLKFYSQGVRLRVPKQRMMVVLFRDHDDFMAFSSKLGPDMASVAGFWHTITNVAVFFDQGESPRFAAVRKLENRFQEMRKDAIKNRSRLTKDIVRTADTLKLILQMAREDADIEVVTHEATHQLAGNTGLLPRNVMIPQWIHEGLASYFESPEEASWSGVGAINEERLDYYRELSRDTKHSNVEFIVGDQVFKFAATQDAKLHGYGQAWALTHFMIERHFDDYMTFCKRLGEMPPDLLLSPDLLTELFEDICQSDLKTLNSEWKVYMRSLKTDIDKILDDEEL